MLKRNSKPARNDPMGPVEKELMARRQSNPEQKQHSAFTDQKKKKVNAKMQITQGDPSQGSDAGDLGLQGELVHHSHRRNQTILNIHHGKTFHICYLSCFRDSNINHYAPACMAARSMSSRLMVAVVDENIIARVVMVAIVLAMVMVMLAFIDKSTIANKVKKRG